MNKGDCFLWGCTGAAIPEVVRMWKIVSSGGQGLPDFSLLYFSISIVYVVFAGLFTIAWNPENPYKAIWVGVSFPTLISSMIQSPPTMTP